MSTSEKEAILKYLSTIVVNSDVLEAFMKLDRRKFLPAKYSDIAYSPKHIDQPIQITKNYNTTALGLGVKMVDLLELKKSDKVLEIGTGSGYYTALMAEIVGAENLYTIEFDEEAYNLAKNNLKEYHGIHLIFGDGSLGYISGSPYDKIIVWASSPTFPYVLYQQMKEKGIMVVPISDNEKRQGLYRIYKGETGSPVITKVMDVYFTRLRGLCGFWY
ncbi:protein-L-isoaspartate O-methyltransferase [Sulfolobus acidocaldarius SUSAZ]|nr:protein-L-isoaspartate O-methyltransferase [Sulfolobus acidocaldarius SUSAZ]